MPFIRQTRDKRGFEHTYVHAYVPPWRRWRPQRPRLLYLFRSPANLRVGRTPLDAEVMEALEHTHPDLSFDWAALEPGCHVVDLGPNRQGGSPGSQACTATA